MIEFDLDKAPHLFETQIEEKSRNDKYKKNKPLKITDYTKGATDNIGV